MPMRDPLRSPIYESGGLIQRCDDCDWAQRGHKTEFIDCPLCGEDLKPPLAIGFGGMVVVYDGTNFVIHDNSGNSVVLQRADYPEIIQFLCKHAHELRTGTIIHDGGRPRRIAKQRDFDLMLWTDR